MTEQDIADLIQAAKSYKVDLSTVQAKLLLQHLELVIERNHVINLTRIIDWQDGINKHILDSLSCISSLIQLELTKDSSCLDIGTGAGFPGIPLAITLPAKFCLIDSTEKKIKEVQNFISTLKLNNCAAHAIRAEELAKKKASAFDFVVARAVSQLSTLIEYAAPLLKMNGYLIALKGMPTKEELQNADYAAKLCGLRFVSRETLELKDNSGSRSLIVLQKTAPALIKLPRNVGVAQHHPLKEKSK